MAGLDLHQIDSYTIAEKIKENASGTLYRCQPTKRARAEIFLKVSALPLLTEADQQLFQERARHLKRLSGNRSIASVRGYGLFNPPTSDGRYGYLVLHDLPIKSIEHYFQGQDTLSPEQILPVLLSIGDALHMAHQRKVVHGNLHPGCILGEPTHAVLTDFALACRDGSLTYDDEPAALPYKAPEQLRGSPLPSSDQYALAALVYHWLCGRPPYEGRTAAELLAQQERQTLIRPRSLNPTLSPELEAVLLQALAFDPGERFPHVRAFTDACLAAIKGLPHHYQVQEREPAVAPLPIIPSPPAGPTASSSESSPVASRRAASATPATATPAPPAPAVLARQSGPDGPVSLKHERSAEEEGEEGLLASVRADLRQGGILSRSLPGYEERPAQIAMAELVAHALEQRHHAILEAATGTGKSLAYLVPIVRSGRVAIISTANKALQEQLFYKDIPFVQQYIKPFGAALVKGMGNYLCLDRLESERLGLQLYAKNREFRRLYELTQDPDADFNGDIESLDFPLSADLRSRVVAERDQCAWSKCPFFFDCYVRQMRLRAEQAQIIVVNHTLLLLDAALEGHLLPERDIIVLDEAHHLEEEATRAFTITISPNQIRTLLAQRMLKEHSRLSLQDEAERAWLTTWRRLEQLARSYGPGARLNLQEPLEEGLQLATVIAQLADSLRQERPRDLPEKESTLYDRLLKRTQNLAEHIRTVFSVNQAERYVYYLERVTQPGQRGSHIEVSAAPLDVTSWLREKLLKTPVLIFTSATLATTGPHPLRPEEKGPHFSYFRQRIGLSYEEMPEVEERILPLTFDYEQNALLYLPRHLPEPAYGGGEAVRRYTEAVAGEMLHLVNASQGRAFLLFSSQRMLDAVYELLQGSALPFRLLRQGDWPRSELLRQFKAEPAVLFGLKSFWEGVDIPGDALSLVVIDKLPFDPPDDPVHAARIALMKEAGENWFGSYVLPQAVLRLKQGLGRLLRTREDRGVMAILDSRIYTKSYGRLIVNALPPARRTDRLAEVYRFFQNGRQPSPGADN
ncbi:helicase C-terminal domain-containing protein [Thermogemmatispora carboxidivorans]|uniref:helicase C-terminal domain-containing protein n=1 Tax=Thermogemmatispora carboxidivorans TaxID=1382306 RepID=UPI00069A5180|nr:helicase C-terminal domain-containing protein [Thermogemmatispora carboxidivorans]